MYNPIVKLLADECDKGKSFDINSTIIDIKKYNTCEQYKICCLPHCFSYFCCLASILMIASVDNGKASIDMNDIRPLYQGKCLNDKVRYKLLLLKACKINFLLYL